MPKEKHSVLYAKLLRKLIAACPPGMRAVAILADGERQGTIGSCCEACTAALIHNAADACEDVREPEELEQEDRRVH